MRTGSFLNENQGAALFGFLLLATIGSFGCNAKNLAPAPASTAQNKASEPTPAITPVGTPDLTAGSGTVLLGSNTYAGGTSILGGTLQVPPTPTATPE